jgi:hypothetical protein
LISIETSNRPQMAQEFINKVGVTFATVNDDQEVSGKLFSVNATPANLMIDDEGRIFFRTYGFAPGHEKIYAAQIEYLLARAPKLGMLAP